MSLLTMSGRRGTVRIADTTKKTSATLPKIFTSIVVLLDGTKISHLKEAGYPDTATALAGHGITVDSELSKGEVIVTDVEFTEIQLSAGAVSIG